MSKLTAWQIECRRKVPGGGELMSARGNTVYMSHDAAMSVRDELERTESTGAKWVVVAVEIVGGPVA